MSDDFSEIYLSRVCNAAGIPVERLAVTIDVDELSRATAGYTIVDRGEYIMVARARASKVLPVVGDDRDDHA